MNIEELTSRLLTDGVEKGNQEAEKIISAAQQQAKSIVESAQQEVANLKEKTDKELQEKQAHVRSELQLYATQVLGSLKTSIVDMICGEIVKDNIKAMGSDPNFMCEIVGKMAESIMKDGSVSIETNQADRLISYFKSNAKNLLNNGISVVATTGNKMQFSIVCEDKNYKIKFGEAEFEEFFKTFLRQQLIDYLF